MKNKKRFTLKSPFNKIDSSLVDNVSKAYSSYVPEIGDLGLDKVKDIIEGGGKKTSKKDKKDKTDKKEKDSPLQLKDACYNKVKAKYRVFPSAYASGAIAKCRKVGAANWGNKSKKK